MSAKKEVQKSFSVPPLWRGARIPGIPGQGGSASPAERLFAMPKEPGPMAMLDHTEPRFSADSVVRGLGFDAATAAVWKSWISKNIDTAPNEVQVRKALFERFLEDRTPPELRRALFQRSLNYFGHLAKSRMQIVTPDQILEKAEARGGTYYRRVKGEKGGYRYYYNPDDYHAREDAHLDGETATKKRITKHVLSHVESAGEEGCDHKPFQTLASRFGADKVAAVLREVTGESGPLKFEKGRFKKRAAEKPQEPVQKSMGPRFIITR